MKHKTNIKKIISVALVVVMIFSTFAIVTNAASYSKGKYIITTSSGVNVRAGAGTKYSVVGAAAKGITFEVSKINGNWGYTNSIKCTDGYQCGWVCLDYCAKSANTNNNTSSKYSTGTYSIASNSGSNVRKGAGSNYAKVGAAAKGITFTVTKVNGVWGYTNSIKCTNGYKSGWICLDYCTKKTASVKSVPATKIKLNTSQITLNGTGANRTVKSTMAPSNTTDKVTWKSANPGIATVNQSGKITAVGNGTTIITATTTSGKKATIKVVCRNCNNWDAKVGKTVASIKSGSSYTKWYNSSGNISARGGYYGQCTWYAYGRFYEVNGIQLKTAPNAKKWLSVNSSDSRVKVTYGANTIKAKSIAVRTSGTYGHVMFIEHVTYDAKGNPQYVYFTECNYDNNGRYDAGKDCILQKMTYSKFVSSKNPAGYISAK